MITQKIRTEIEQIEFFEQCLSKFNDAVTVTGSIQRYYHIAETIVCIVFAGPAMIKVLTPALDHLETDPVAAPDLVLNVWDSESTSIKMAPPPCDWSNFTDRGDIWGFTSKRIKTAFHWIENSVNIMDLDRKTGIFWVQRPHQLPFWVFASPLRTLFHWWMEKNHCQLIHAAAVGTDKGAVVITGKGGVGKSTTALSCLDSGMSYLGDDYVIVWTDGQESRVYSLYCTAKLNTWDRDVFPSLSALIRNTGSLDKEKAVMCLYPEMASQIALKMPLKALVTPVISGRKKTGITPIHHWNIQRAMSFTTMSQLPCVGRHTHNYISRLACSIPVHQLDLGSDLSLVPGAIIRLVKEAVPAERQIAGPLETMDEYPLVSVIIPVYNGERFIREAIDNVLSQHYPALELIVVNDGSWDNTLEILDQVNADIRIFTQKNQGPSQARNRGIKDTSGDYILFLDVDDLWPENTLALLVDEIHNNPDLDVVRGYAQVTVENPDTGEYEYSGNPKNSFKDYIGAGIYRKSVFTRVGLFDPGLKFGEDSDWYARASEMNIPMKRLDDVTLHVRRHGANMTEGKNLVELNTLQVFKKSLDRKRSLENNGKQAASKDKPRKPGSISVIIPVYNREAFIREAIQSVLDQTHGITEIIVVDDGSTDATAEIIKHFPAPPIRYLYQQNLGPAAARNRGILESTGELIAFLDSDDLWVKNKLELQVDHLNKTPYIQAIVGMISYFQEPDSELPGNFNPKFLHGNHAGLLIQSMLARRSVFHTVGLFNPEMKTAEDIDWFSRASDMGITIGSVPQVLTAIRIHGKNLSFNTPENTKNIMASLRQSINRKSSVSRSVSVIIPVHNADRYLKEAVDSVLCQEPEPGEIIIIDDGSTDTSRAVAESYGPRVTLLTQENKGAAAARNQGIQAAKGSLLAFLDADDVWKPGKMKTQLDYLTANPGIDMVFGRVEQFISPEIQHKSAGPLRKDLTVMPGFVIGTLLIRRSAFDRVGFLKEDVRLGEFIDWFHRSQVTGLAHHMIDTTVLRRRIHQTNQGITLRSRMNDYTSVLKGIIDRKRRIENGSSSESDER